MAGSRVGALAYLGYRAVVAQPLKRMRHQGTGLDRFLASYGAEGLAPTSPEDRAVGEAASACIACGLCATACDLAGAVPAIRAAGLPAAFRLYGRSTDALRWSREALAACAGCGDCDAICPTGVPIGRVVRHLLARAEGVARPVTARPEQPT